MKAKTIRLLNCKKTANNPRGVWPVGTVIDNPDSWLLVTHGVAIPDDEECRIKAGMTPAEMVQQQHVYNRLAAGIHPDDWAAFDAGEMIGYDAQGRKIPGPNFVGGEAEFNASGDHAEHETLT
jgi:hypothetical protein